MHALPRMSLKLQIAGLAVFVAVCASIAAATLPNLIFDARDQLFLMSLDEDDRVRLRETEQLHGSCGVETGTLKRELGFQAWKFQSEWALGGVTVLTALGMGALSLVLAGGVAVPIRRIASHARSVAEGERSPPAPVGFGVTSEVVALNEDFAAMTRALAAADDDLRLRSAAVAHDIRTPLAVLRGRLIGLREDIFKADERFISGLLDQISLLDGLVTDINTLADANHAASMNREDVELAALVKDTTNNLRPELEANGLALNFDIDGPAWVRADPNKLQRAILNVLRNVEHHAASSALRISLEKRARKAVLTFADSGPGWPPDVDIERFLEPFTRGEASRSRETGGSGLGLAIVAAVVKAYDGQVRLDSTSEGGAVVEISLPVSDIDVR